MKLTYVRFSGPSSLYSGTAQGASGFRVTWMDWFLPEHHDKCGICFCTCACVCVCVRGYVCVCVCVCVCGVHTEEHSPIAKCLVRAALLV